MWQAGSWGGEAPDSNSPERLHTREGRVKGKQGRSQKRWNVRQLGAKVRYEWSWSRKGSVREPQGRAGRKPGALTLGHSRPLPATPQAPASHSAVGPTAHLLCHGSAPGRPGVLRLGPASLAGVPRTPPPPKHSCQASERFSDASAPPPPLCLIWLLVRLYLPPAYVPSPSASLHTFPQAVTILLAQEGNWSQK